MTTELTGRQLTNARTIYDAAIPFGTYSAKAALMTALAESSLLVYANNGNTTRDDVPQKWRDLAALSMGFPHDAVAGEAWTTADSVGWFQQRPMYGYCTPDRAGIGDLMSPESVRIFIRGSHGGKGSTKFFLQSPADMSLAKRCQWTQGSEFPTGENYAPHEGLATQLIAAFTTNTTKTEEDIMASREELQKDIETANAALRAEVAALKAEVIAQGKATRAFSVSGNVLNAYSKAQLAYDIGTGQSYAAVLAGIIANQQRTLTRLDALAKDVAALRPAPVAAPPAAPAV